MRPPANLRVIHLALLVFFSGVFSTRISNRVDGRAALVFGATTAAVAAVLAIFMAGLGIGGAPGKRIERRIRCSCTAPGSGNCAQRCRESLAYNACQRDLHSIRRAESPWDFLERPLCACSPPRSWGSCFLDGRDVAGGGSAVTSAADVHRCALGVLYGANTLGAVVGAATPTLFALESLGTRATLWLGCAIGLVVGTIAIGLCRLRPLDEPGNATLDSAANVQPFEDVGNASHFRPWLIYTTAAVLGFSFFALELMWYRMLSPILGGTAFTFGLILCWALLGIGLGGLAYNWLFNRIRPSWSALAVTCGCEALFTIVPFALGDHLAIMAARRNESAENFHQLVFGWSFIIGIAVFPVAFVSGLQFPLLTGLLGRGRRTVSEHLGRTYAWNTSGAIAGSLIAGFGAMPLLTAPGLWQAIAGLLAVLSVGILIAAPGIGRRAWAVVAVLVLATFGSMFADGPTAAWRHGG